MLLTNWLSFDATMQTFAWLRSREKNFLDAVREASRATLEFSLSTAHYEESYGFEQALTFAGGEINVRIVNTDGCPAKEFSDISLVARGFNTGYSTI